MAKPARQFRESEPGNTDSAPAGRRHLRVVRPGEDVPPPEPYDEPDEDERGNDEPTPSRSQLKALEGDGQTTPRGKDHLSVVPDQEANFYKKSEKSDSRGRLGFLRRKRTLAGGGVIGILGALLIVALTSGPLEFIHIAQTLQRIHFSTSEDQDDDRVMRIARFVRYQGKGKVEKVRLGVVGNKIADRLEARMNKSGIKTAYDSTWGFRDGYVVDPQKLTGTDFEKLQGKSPAELKVYFEENFPNITVREGTGDLKGKLFVDTSGNDFKFGFGKNKITKFMLQASGMNKVAATVGWRLMGARAAVNWHPLTTVRNKLLRNATQRLTDWRKNRVKEISKGSQLNVSVDNRADPQKDPADAARAQEAADAASSTAQEGTTANQELNNGDPKAFDKIKGTLNSAKLSRTLVATGVLCLLKAIDDRSDSLKLGQVALNSIRQSTNIDAVGNQAPSGQDVDPETLGFYKTLLNNGDGSWVNAQSLQAEFGNPNTGVAPPETLKKVNKKSPFHILNQSPANIALNPVCSTGGQLVQVGLSLLTGGVESTIVSTAAGAVLAGKAIDEAAHWLAGNAVNPLAAGPEFGNVVNYGAKFSANLDGVTGGGRKLTSDESHQLKTYAFNSSQEEFQNHNLAYKILNTNDSRSVISKVIDQQNPNLTSNLNHIATSILNFGHIFGSLPKLFARPALAASVPDYDYGFPDYGFSEGEMNNPKVKNPYKNACEVVGCTSPDGHRVIGILERPSGKKYIKRAEDCFGTIIDKTTYDITSFGTDAIDPNNPDPTKQNFYTDQDHNSDPHLPNCTDANTNWLQVRFYVYDTKNIDSINCYLGKDDDPETKESCNRLGFTEDATVAASVNTGTIAQGSASTLAKKLLDYSKSGEYRCDNAGDCTDLQKVVSNQSLAGSSACIAQTLDLKVLQTLLYLIEVGHFKIGTYALCGDHGPDGPHGHNGGFAVDISSVNGAAINQNTTQAKEETLKLDEFLNKMPTELVPRQLITYGYGQHYDADLAALQLYDSKSCGSSCLSIYTPGVESQHTNHVHVGF